MLREVPVFCCFPQVPGGDAPVRPPFLCLLHHRFACIETVQLFHAPTHTEILYWEHIFPRQHEDQEHLRKHVLWCDREPVEDAFFDRGR